VASLDEWHQAFLPSRTGVLSDVVLDSCAGFTAQIAILLILRARASRTAEAVPANTAPQFPQRTLRVVKRVSSPENFGDETVDSNR